MTLERWRAETLDVIFPSEHLNLNKKIDEESKANRTTFCNTQIV